ncbi:MAG: hypothetical protein Q8K98_07675 [Bacteroidota bacterium]|nr:hypothetical protein [Bacteroidota bacterium]
MKDILDNLWNNKEWLFSGLGIVIIGAIFSLIRNYKNSKLKVKLSLTVEIVQIAERFGPSTPMLTVRITNAGKCDINVRHLFIVTSKKIRDTKFFQVHKKDPTFQLPFELLPRHERSIPLRSQDLSEHILANLKERNTIRVAVEDTLGKKYYSNRFTVRQINEHNRIAEIE